MRGKKIKATIFSVLLILMLSYIGWVFYMSEPSYVDNCYKKVEKFDYVSVSYSDYKSLYDSELNKRVENGIILQIDSSKAIAKVGDEFKELDLKAHNFRIIGRGTIYHKVNCYVGLNIMFITQVFIGIICALLIITLISLLNDILVTF
jgi:hypothetical protein